jgi:arylsulfatase A-like enzyme
MDDVVEGAGFQWAEDAGAIGGNHHSSFGVDDFSTVDRVLQWIDQRNGAPFFVHYLPIAGHHPYHVPVQGPFVGTGVNGHDADDGDQVHYLNALHYSDLALRRLVQGLAGRGFLRNTLLVIYGDHGEAFGEHPGNFGHTLYLYEENLRVPLIFRAPGILRQARIGRVTSLVDLAPSVCDLLGLRLPAEFEGISAFGAQEHPALFLTDYSMRLYGLRSGRWKFIHEMETGFRRLYDLKADPRERTNLARVRPEIVLHFRRGSLSSLGRDDGPQRR